jgi:high-affinity iron transporter
MIPAFVIGLREGVEAALIVGMMAAFLARSGRRDALRAVWAGVAIAIVLCLGVGLGLDALDRALPQRQQETLEAGIALLACAVVTAMIFWMRRHARALRGELVEAAGRALASGSTTALVAMAFFAVIREGFETAVFLLAAFQQSTDPRATGTGAILGLLLAAVVGAGIYRGGVRLDLARFFRITSIVLVVVAAGLVASALHAAHEAGIVDSLQGAALDLTWLAAPGSVRGALLAGMFGVQPMPTVAELLGWLVYATPMLLIVSQVPRAAARTATSARHA